MVELAGLARRATYFSLLRQRKVSKRKATRLSGSLRFASGNLRCPGKTGVGANSLHCVTLKQRAALIPFFRGITGPDRTGLAGNEIRTAEQPNGHRDPVSTLNATNSIAGCAIPICANKSFYPHPNPNSSPPRPGWACAAREKRDQGRALFERSEFARTPVFLRQRRLPVAQRRDPDSRVTFLLLTFLWRSQEK